MSFDEFENNGRPEDYPVDPEVEPEEGKEQGAAAGDGVSEEPASAADVHDESGAAEPPRQPVKPVQPRRVVQPYGYNEDHRTTWTDPVYESAAPAGSYAYTPGSYAYGAQSAPKPKKKKSHWFLKAACLVLVCALISGGVCYAIVDYKLSNTPAINNGNNVVLGQPMSSGTDKTPSGDVTYTGEELTGSQIYQLAYEQVVGVNTNVSVNAFGQTSTRAVSGSGFIISADGYILTNYHVISYAVVYGGELTVLMNDGTRYPATVKGYVEDNDVAVIKIDATGLTPVALGNSDEMVAGEWVYAVGNPLGELAYSMTPGIVSALDRVISTEDEITGTSNSINMFQISAAVNAGNSGGPVYNSRGEVLGIVTAKYADEGIEGLGFAIPINDALSIATQIIEKGYVATAGLGITGRNVSAFYKDFAMEYYNIPYGVHVESVNAGSAAETAGILPGDIITGLGDKQVTSMDELKLALRRYSPGDTEKITVYRIGSSLDKGEYIDLTVTFEELAADNSQDNDQPQSQIPDIWGDFFGGGR